jgi:P27 family predicted phage terminase small subunit
MAGRAKQSIDVLMGKNNRSHLTKAEIDKRKKEELHFACDDITTPECLTDDEKIEFNEFVEQMRDKGIINNLTVDSLASFFVSRREYLKFTSLLEKISVNEENIDYYNKLSLIQDRAYKKMRQAAADNGLTITSQNRLVAPVVAEEKKSNKFEKFAM